MKKLKATVLACVSTVSLCAVAAAQGGQPPGDFQLASTEFSNGEILPVSALFNYPVSPGGPNACSNNGAAGGDLSPELHWSHAPRGTRSFVVMVYDETAAVVHWGMYNISGTTTELPQNAGAANSNFGLQVTNVFGDESYDGPCPPAGVAPDTHRYVFTVYALDDDLEVYAPVNFPPSALTLYRDLLKAAREDHVLGSARLVGLYSATPSTN